jgi:hypothetical protein
VRVTYRQPGPPSAPLQALERLGIASFADGPAPLLELTFDDARTSTAHDLHPTLPLLLRW